MKRILSFFLLLIMTGCAKVVTIPAPNPPPDISVAVSAIAESNLSPEAKAIALRQLAETHTADLAYLERVYDKEVSRAREAGDNIRSWMANLLAIVGTAVSVTLAATK